MRGIDRFSTTLGLPLFALAAMGSAAPAINGHAVDRRTYDLMVAHGFLPTRTSFLSDEELAAKLDLDLPQLEHIKSALDAKNRSALRKELVVYLESKLRPLDPATSGKPISFERIARADAWLGKTMTFDVNGAKRTLEIGARADWFHLSDGWPDIAGWSSWGNALADAYLATADPKYAQGLLTYVRAFYRDCRPPAQRTTSWDGSLGPWAVGGRGRATGLLQWIYTVVARAPVTTEADRLMFLKMIYEHAEVMYLFSDEHQVTNFEFYPITVLGLIAHTFPEFRDSKRWRARAIERVLENMDDSVLDDGGSEERSQYHGSYLHSYTQAYRTLLGDSPRTPEFRGKLESMYEWFMWMLSPTRTYPSLNIGSMNDMSGYAAPAGELFPERDDLVYLATQGARGTPPLRTSRVLAHTGFLTMRSDWSSDALYMAMNYNGTLPEIPGTNPDLLSFAVWAHGRAYMTNAGTPVSYAHPLLRDWCTQTKASNTVLVDQVSQYPIANAGRLAEWQDRRGFTYLAAVSENYRNVGVEHRRAVLFLRPDYWVTFDRLVPTDKNGTTHDYRWQGHFQPMDLAIDAATKTVATSSVDGKRLFVVPLHPELLSFERGQGLVADGVHMAENAVEGPYVRFITQSNQATSFTVLIDPVSGGMPAPTAISLPIEPKRNGVSGADATGALVRQGGREDVIGMAVEPGLRAYGSLVTDGEVAYVRRDRGSVTSVGLVGGRKVDYDGVTLLEVGPEIESASIEYDAARLRVSVRGRGTISILAGSEREILVNDMMTSSVRTMRWGPKRRRIIVAEPPAVELENPSLSDDPTAVYKALVGFRPSSAVPPWNPVVVSWRTPVPADATIAYAPYDSDAWVRTMKPDPTLEHRIVLSRLTPGTTYRLRLRSSTEDGRVGTSELSYRCPTP
jgi:hypothetical protein